MKRYLRWLVCLLLFGQLLFACPVVFAEEATYSVTSELLEEQLDAFGGSDLSERLPEETQEDLEEWGVSVTDPESASQVSASQILSKLLETIVDPLSTVTGVFLTITAVMMVVAMVQSMQLSFGEQPVGSVVHFVGMLCILAVLLTPLLTCIEQLSNIIHGGAYFMLGCVPVMIGFLVAGGQLAAGSSFGGILLTVCNGIALLSSNWMIPVLQLFLGFSTVSSISPNLHLDGICKSCYTAMKWILGFVMTLFSGLLTMQGLLGSAVDVTTNKSVKFVVSSFVPIVGNALGEAFGTIHSCAKVLRSGVGAFGILGLILLFLPVLVQCVLWMIGLSLAAGLGDLFELSAIASLLRSISKVLSMGVAMLLCSAVILIVSLEIMMMTGGSV